MNSEFPFPIIIPDENSPHSEVRLWGTRIVVRQVGCSQAGHVLAPSSAKALRDALDTAIQAAHARQAEKLAEQAEGLMWADQVLAINLKSLPTLPSDLLGTELRMTAHTVAAGQATPQDVTYLTAICKEITRRGLTKADATTAAEDRIAVQDPIK
ncbi:hypothetical protein [Streptosporangium saharense]|uniref:hypothetical protein n=1 Tax=Streptosporangium saharense TaxID=1706840 RepID=UPI0033321731